jgi:hypothetical protein
MNTASSPLVTSFTTPSPLLRRALLTDATLTAFTGLALAFAGGPLGALLSLPPTLLTVSGLILIPFALFVGWLGTRHRISRPLVLAAIALNVLWTFDSVILLFTGWVEPNALGEIFTIGQAVIVAILAQAEFLGLRRSTLVESFARH